MLNFQNLLVHIIGLVIYCYPKNHIQVVYFFHLQISRRKQTTNVQMKTISVYYFNFQMENF